MPVASEDVARWVREDFDLVLRDLSVVPHGADQSAQVWRAGASDGRWFAVKLTGAGSAAGLLVPHALVAQGIQGIPALVVALDGRIWSERDRRRLSVAAWVEGPRAAEVELEPAHWRSLGRLLRQVHDAPVPPAVADVLPAATSLTSALVAAKLALDVRCCEPAPDEIAEHTTEVWRAATTALSAVVDAVASLEPDPSSLLPHISHTDPHLGNLLVDGPDRMWLIDWDDVALAPPERDLMFALVGVPFFGPVEDEQREAFLDGYGPTPIHRELVAFYACTRALEDMTDWARRALDVQLPAAERQECLDITRDLVSPQGLLARSVALVRDLGLSAG
ncbi:phosphotransferase enzyme family protein [Angustibacter sp. McL0619]|uniref:phosphotransferase enzyme family protein n=1 Tax=Angustibacter sp. McL0619 TaxID=3415676 RepID=UPI003CEF84AC